MRKLVVGILAHVDAGKPTLSEALLYQSGALRRLGRVDHQDAFLDTDAMERERGITIFSKQAVFSLKDTEVTLLDTPGHVDFNYEVSRSLAACEGAVLIDTGGAPLLEDAVAGKVWSVTFDEKLVLVATNGNTSVKASLVGGSTQLYNDENGAYAISIANQACYLDSGSNFTSNWGGRMTLKPHNMNFTYSDCMGEKFVVNTTGAIYGPSFYTMDNATSLELSMTLTDVEYYTRSSIREGKFEAMMTGGYDFTAFPSPKVTVKYAVSADGKKLLTTIEYAGNTVTI